MRRRLRASPAGVAENLDAAGPGEQEAHQGLDGCRFSGAVGADETDALPLARPRRTCLSTARYGSFPFPVFHDQVIDLDHLLPGAHRCVSFVPRGPRRSCGQAHWRWPGERCASTAPQQPQVNGGYRSIRRLLPALKAWDVPRGGGAGCGEGGRVAEPGRPGRVRACGPPPRRGGAPTPRYSSGGSSGSSRSAVAISRPSRFTSSLCAATRAS